MKSVSSSWIKNKECIIKLDKRFKTLNWVGVTKLRDWLGWMTKRLISNNTIICCSKARLSLRWLTFEPASEMKPQHSFPCASVIKGYCKSLFCSWGRRFRVSIFFVDECCQRIHPLQPFCEHLDFGGPVDRVYVLGHTLERLLLAVLLQPLSLSFERTESECCPESGKNIR